MDAGYGQAASLPEFEYRHPRKKISRVRFGQAIDIGAYEYKGGAGAYDFNHDDKLNVLDVVSLLLALARGDSDPAFDLNGDSALTGADAISLMLVILDLS